MHCLNRIYVFQGIFVTKKEGKNSTMSGTVLPPPAGKNDETQCCEEANMHKSCSMLGCQMASAEDLEHTDYDPQKFNISFAGCGFLGIYHMGVASAFHHFLPNSNFERLCGASAGALAATGLVAGIPVSK